MPGIDPSVMVHRLNVSPFFPPYSTEEASVRSRTGQGHSGRDPQIVGRKLH